MYGNKIRTFRTLRGFSQEDMASRLKIAQNTYSKIESDKQKLTHEMLESIATELGVTIADLTSQEPIIIHNQASNHGTQIGHNENLYIEQKDLYAKLLDAKDKEIERLSKQVEKLLGMLGKK